MRVPSGAQARGGRGVALKAGVLQNLAVALLRLRLDPCAGILMLELEVGRPASRVSLNLC